MTIRRLEADDVMDCCRIASLNWNNDVARQTRIELESSFCDFPWPPIYYVKEEDCSVVGFCGYNESWLDNGIYEITNLNVHPYTQKKGVGQQLMRKCLDEISYLGHTVLIRTLTSEYYETHFDFKTIYKDDHYIMIKGV